MIIATTLSMLTISLLLYILIRDIGLDCEQWEVVDYGLVIGLIGIVIAEAILVLATIL